MTLRELFYALKEQLITCDELVFAHHHASWLSVAQLDEMKPLLRFLPEVIERESALPPPLPGQIPQVFFNQGDKIHSLEQEVLLYQEILELIPTESFIADSGTHTDVKRLYQKVQLLEEEAIQFKNRQQRLEAEKSLLKQTIKEQRDLDSTINLQRQDHTDYAQELKEAQSQVVSLQMKLEEIKNLEADGIEAIEASKKAQVKLNEVLKQNNSQKESVKKVQQENLFIKNKYQKLYSAYKNIKNEFKNSRAGSAIDETSVDFSLDSLNQTNHLALDISEKNSQHENDLKRMKLIHGENMEKDALSVEEVQRLTGNLFEIDNAAHWYVKDNDSALGPYSFEQMIEMKNQDEISPHCMIRHSKETWKPMSNTYEFCVPYKFSISREGDQLVKRYYLKRETVRVPFYELVNLDLDQGSIKGYCTSLSVGGCFIELGRAEMKKIAHDAQVKLELNSDVLSESLVMNAKIVNISEARPRGIGMMFIEPSEESKEIIQTYVNHCLDSADHKKKAA